MACIFVYFIWFVRSYIKLWSFSADLKTIWWLRSAFRKFKNVFFLVIYCKKIYFLFSFLKFLAILCHGSAEFWLVTYPGLTYVVYSFIVMVLFVIFLLWIVSMTKLIFASAQAPDIKCWFSRFLFCDVCSFQWNIHE